MPQSGGGTSADTPGQRLYQIRLALGDGVKNAMRIEDFVALVKRVTGATYDPSAISRTENGGRKLTLEDAPIFAAVDPRHRGRNWLAWGDPPQSAPDRSHVDADPTLDRRVTEAEIASARRLREKLTGKKRPRPGRGAGGAG